MSPRNPLEDLLDLQLIDMEIDRLLDERQTLPALDKYKQAHEAAEEAKSALAVAQEEAKRIHLALDKSDGELTIAEEKRDSEERRLYAGGLNARETDALMKEVEMLKRQTAEREEQTLALMDERDAQATVVDGKQADLDAATGEAEKLEAQIKTAWAEIDAEVARQEEKKAEAVKPIDAELMEAYEEMRPIKDGVAIARLGEDICGGCHLRLSEAEKLQASKTDPPRCVHCRRILILQ